MSINFKKIKSFLVIFVILTSFVLVLGINAEEPASSVSGLLREAGGAAKFETAPEKADLIILIGKIINVFLSLLGIIFILLALYGGYLWMTARGNEEQVSKSKNLLRDAVIGFVIIVGAYAITYFVMATIAKNYVTGGGGF